MLLFRSNYARCRAPRLETEHFILGFGSIIQTASRRASDPTGAADAVPCRIGAGFGYVREWNYQSATSQICALGLRKCAPGERGSTINGVLFPAPSDLTSFDQREAGYRRVEVPLAMVELLSWQRLPPSCSVSVYVVCVSPVWFDGLSLIGSSD